MKVLFLDIDGVLNSIQSAIMFQKIRDSGKVSPKFEIFGEDGLCPVATSNLEHIVSEVPDLKIVISSTWRLGASLKDLKKICSFSEKVSECVIDSTPVIKDAPRGEEIAYWLRQTRHKVRAYAVVDDDSDMDAVEDNFFQTDNKDGLMYTLAQEIIEHLNKEETHDNRNDRTRRRRRRR